MTERPILMNAPMVRALLAGTKTQTRRMVKPQPDTIVQGVLAPPVPYTRTEPDHYRQVRCPYGVPGDVLWVREAFRKLENASESPSEPVWYMADGEPDHGHWTGGKPSIHMPRWASRISLTVTDVRVERLQDISEGDARAEGASFHDGRGVGHSGWRHDLSDVHADARSAYARLWEQINGPGSWAANPWVWAVSFDKISSPEEKRP